MNALSRDLMWVSPATVGEIARFRVMAADFRESGELDVLLSQFEEELETKRFLNREDNGLVKGFFVSLARSQRLIRAAARGDWEGCELALDQKADPSSRDGWGRTALHAALLNGRVNVVAALLRQVSVEVASIKTMDNETPVDLAKQSGCRENQVLVRHKIFAGGREEYVFPEIVLRAIEGEEEAVQGCLTRADPSSEQLSGSEPLVGGGIADVDAPDDEGFTALYYAVSLRHVAVVRLLTQAGARSDVPVPKVCESALDCAIRLGYDDVVAALKMK